MAQLNDEGIRIQFITFRLLPQAKYMQQFLGSQIDTHFGN